MLLWESWGPGPKERPLKGGNKKISRPAALHCPGPTLELPFSLSLCVSLCLSACLSLSFFFCLSPLSIFCTTGPPRPPPSCTGSPVEREPVAQGGLGVGAELTDSGESPITSLRAFLLSPLLAS